MVIATTEIQGGEYFCVTKLGKHFIYFWQWVQAHAPSGTRVNFCLQDIDMVIVHTHPPLGGFSWVRLFWYNDYQAGPRAEALLMTPAHLSCSISFLTHSWCFNGRVYGLWDMGQLIPVSMSIVMSSVWPVFATAWKGCLIFVKKLANDLWVLSEISLSGNTHSLLLWHLLVIPRNHFQELLEAFL